eukprot:CAMPEP_0176420878 /NCGR_PEP_ID=MMETSP0127-20121128/8852_1 /TAXON_ID=938130 /ORGANISM="Platyophrya macrostoma, Strain WH" /LENGTH=643 /DNA_ID=CAMNT_0017801525 /DNA_START=83 /DNA_END=2014 /DNA_ORIENTATION=+
MTLSKTQRKTPTVVHPQYHISRIRSFYIRKVKFTAETLHEKFNEALEGFPKLDEIHPFYADWINILYDKDHYKLALGHIHSAKNMMDNIAKDYVRYLKYSDTPYRCKMLKRAALGRMMTAVKRLGPSLNFLEEVRKHMGRLPSINPLTRTLLICGFPNTGKTSFLNRITHANGDVQPYAFTTQSLYVGHTEYNDVRFQVIDTPGVLDRPIKEMSTIEMQAVNALAHFKASILYFMDLSESCGHFVDEQIALFENIRPFFKNKPLVLVFNKVDLKGPNDIDPEVLQRIQAIAEEHGAKIMTMSTETGDGVSQVKELACQLITQYRKEHSNPNATTDDIRREETFLNNGIYVAMPKARRDNIDRKPQIPEQILKGERVKLDRPTLKQLEESMGGAGVFNFPLQEHYDLENPDEKYDVVPEFMDGKNVADFYDKEIMKRLKELEKEEEMYLAIKNNKMDEEDSDEYDEEMVNALKEVRERTSQFKIGHKMKQNKRAYPRNIPLEKVEETLEKKGLPTDQVRERFKEKRKGKPLSHLEREVNRAMDVEDGEGAGEDDMDDEEGVEEKKNERAQRKLEKRKRSLSKSRSVGAREVLDERTQAMVNLKKKLQNYKRNEGTSGEGDRRVIVKLPKHLYAGKRSNGKTDRR